MRVGIVGSRRRNTGADRQIVFGLVRSLLHQYQQQALVLVSGGCPRGADAFAKQAALYYGLAIVEHLPVQNPPPRDYCERTQRFYDRNRLIAEDSDIVYALVAPDRKGGVENAIDWARANRKPVVLL